MTEEKKIAVPINPKHIPDAAIDCPYCEYVIWIEQDTVDGQCRWCDRPFSVIRDERTLALFKLEVCTHCDKLAVGKVSGWIDEFDAGEGWQLVCEDHLKEFQDWDFMEKDTLHGFSSVTDIEEFKIVG